jgi:hypothetical protein
METAQMQQPNIFDIQQGAFTERAWNGASRQR